MEALRGKVVLITGSSSGIGAVCAVEFAKKGSKVFLVSNDDASCLEYVRQQCIAAGLQENQVSFVVADLLEEEGIKLVSESVIACFGTVDILVNNAGAASPGDSFMSGSADTKALDLQYKLSVKAPWLLTRLLVDELIKNKGCIINTSSVASKVPAPGFTAYGCMKAAMNHLTQSMAVELGPHGVRVNAVLPGFVKNTKMMTRSSGLTEETGQKILATYARSSQLLREELIVPEDIAGSVVYLASDVAAKMTGVLLSIDAGASLSNPSQPLFQQMHDSA